MRRNHPVHGPKSLCNACGVRMSRRTKADKHKVSSCGKLPRATEHLLSGIEEDIPRTRTERKRSARALDALGLETEDASSVKQRMPSNSSRLKASR